jgi:ribosomal protein L11 methyltransferase
MDWFEIAVAADDEAIEAVAEIFRANGYGVAIDEPFVQPRLDEAPLRDPTRRPIVKTYVPDDERAPETQRRIEEALWHVSQLRLVEPLGVRRIAEEDWANAWKDFFPVLHIGRHTVIIPAWRRHRKVDGEVRIRLDPGMAFGTGMHPTTRLCLEAVENLVTPGMRVLDVGTGSAILSIAAAHSGAGEVVGVDVDPVAVKSARENVALNHLTRRVLIFEGSIDAVFSTPVATRLRRRATEPERALQFDLVLANITARANAAIAPLLARALHPQGKLVASGIIEDAAPIAESAFEEAGLRVIDRQQEGDWLALTAVHA